MMRRIPSADMQQHQRAMDDLLSRRVLPPVPGVLELVEVDAVANDTNTPRLYDWASDPETPNDDAFVLPRRHLGQTVLPELMQSPIARITEDISAARTIVVRGKINR